MSISARQWLARADRAHRREDSQDFIERAAAGALVEIAGALEEISNALHKAQHATIPGKVERAASIYLEAMEDGRLPLKAVMKELDLTKPTASRRIRAARDLGLIPEKGEQA